LKIAACPTPPLPALAWLASSDVHEQRAAFEALTPGNRDAMFDALDFDCAWHDVSQLAEVLPDVGIVRHLLAMVQGQR
jgi:hypothetical protein